ncbi:trimeric LpxA-like protein [Aspergillus steynii IBT 23096]|uniref:Trimeric LpxA-like protein n=1 Tax=Aspergillus steynii IBT 23096 TaxID=1392250 RepID=A0A2I2GMD6_9EURO|nr:trimeric LpxA-like protein [Aspergillus steynii IBT 23096]PLB54048.1 trimeric LpxA-like protein [Aspergillus steynii IBT 23096]
MISNVNESDNLARMQRGELYYAFSPDLVAARKRCARIVNKLNNASDPTRREMAEFWRQITNDPAPLPSPFSPNPSDEAEDATLHAYPWIERPIAIDYGTNIKVGSNVFINFNCTFLDTCLVTIGSRVLVGPNVSFYSGTHPVDPYVRNGTSGPESGRPISIGDDCWIAGHVVILPGVTIGEGCTVGAGSVVTKVGILILCWIETDSSLVGLGCSAVSCCRGESSEDSAQD